MYGGYSLVLDLTASLIFIGVIGTSGNSEYLEQAGSKLSTNIPKTIVDPNMDIKQVYKMTKNWQGDQCAQCSYSWDGLNCSYNNLLRIISLNLAGNKIMVKDKSLDLSMGENPSLFVTASCAAKKNYKFVFLVVSIGAVLVQFLLSILRMIFWNYNQKKQAESNKEGSFTESKKESLKWRNQEFTYSDIESITDHFKNSIGSGGFGEVYLGTLENGNKVAVKVHAPSSMQGTKEFQAEVQLLMRTYHKNLVSLIGYCNEGTHMAIVYEYMANENLRHHLSDKSPEVLSWQKRLQIAIDTARGLEYLHNSCEPPIIHRDMKTSNILLNERLQAKITDFGLSRDFKNEGDTHVSTVPAGTHGYIDPKYYTTGQLNEKSDVYSFGIVLLELITGQRAVIVRGEEYIHIAEWIRPMIRKKDIQNIVDQKLKGKFSTKSAWKAVKIAMLCVPSSTAIQRPDMSHIVMELKECLAIEMASKRTRRMVSSEIEMSPSSSLDENRNLWQTDSCAAKKKKNKLVFLVGSNIGGVLDLIFRHCGGEKQGESNEQGSLWSRNQKFTYSKIGNITGKFKTVIGEGGFGKVYLGTLKNGNHVAVKVASPKSWQGPKEFQNEARLFLRVHHRNLVSLIGYCDDGKHMALIYEYMARGTLRHRLSDTNTNALNWQRRLQIAIDVAQGLKYLHNDCTPPIIHRDLKTLNILLNERLEAKIADFGLSLHFKNDSDSHVSTALAGTRGYMDPEYQTTGRFSTKSDVYSFGIVLLELITGQHALIPKGLEPIPITRWVSLMIERRDIQNIVDTKLQGYFNTDSASKAVDIAMSCTLPTANERPDMSRVVAELEKCLEIETNGS